MLYISWQTCHPPQAEMRIRLKPGHSHSSVSCAGKHSPDIAWCKISTNWLVWVVFPSTEILIQWNYSRTSPEILRSTKYSQKMAVTAGAPEVCTGKSNKPSSRPQRLYADWQQETWTQGMTGATFPEVWHRLEYRCSLFLLCDENRDREGPQNPGRIVSKQPGYAIVLNLDPATAVGKTWLSGAWGNQQVLIAPSIGPSPGTSTHELLKLHSIWDPGNQFLLISAMSVPAPRYS